MRSRLVSSVCVLAGVVAMSASTASTASAAPIGQLTMGMCAGGGVTVTATSIDWLLLAGGAIGCIMTGQSTNVSYTGGGPLVSAVQGQILDLAAGSPFPVADFMTFNGNSNLHFDLNSLGPGVANTNCAALMVGQSCSVFAGSPFILTKIATGTAATLSAVGTARDLSATTSQWTGAFTTQLAGLSPLQIQNILTAPGGSISTTYSGDFTLSMSTVPEPMSMALLGLGLVGVSLRARKSR